jgi:DNA-binding transcriptional LysR family regulator
MAGRREGQTAVPLKEFLTAVVSTIKAGGTVSDAAAELNLTPAAVSARIKSLRERGVKVPQFASSRSVNVADEAQSILDELMG